MRVHGTGILSAAGPYHDIVSSVRVWRQQKEKTLSCYSNICAAGSHLPSLQPQLYLLWHATMEISTRLGHRLVNSWHMQVCSQLLFFTELGNCRYPYKAHIYSVHRQLYKEGSKDGKVSPATLICQRVSSQPQNARGMRQSSPCLILGKPE